MSAPAFSGEAQKREAGEAAAALVQDFMTVGLGTGSTAAFFVEALGRRARAEDLRLRCVATSHATEQLARRVGLELVELDDARSIDLIIDGADEIGPGLNLIKGGGGALLREKLVWEASRRRVVIADQAKQVARLGRFPLPVEVVAFGHATTADRLRSAMHSGRIEGEPRLRVGQGGPIPTDGGNLIYDLPCGAIPDPAWLAASLKGLTGVVEHGLFLGLAQEALIGTEGGVQRLTV